MQHYDLSSSGIEVFADSDNVPELISSFIARVDYVAAQTEAAAMSGDVRGLSISVSDATTTDAAAALLPAVVVHDPEFEPRQRHPRRVGVHRVSPVMTHRVFRSPVTTRRACEVLFMPDIDSMQCNQSPISSVDLSNEAVRTMPLLVKKRGSYVDAHAAERAVCRGAYPDLAALALHHMDDAAMVQLTGQEQLCMKNDLRNRVVHPETNDAASRHAAVDGNQARRVATPTVSEADRDELMQTDDGPEHLKCSCCKLAMDDRRRMAYRAPSRRHPPSGLHRRRPAGE